MSGEIKAIETRYAGCRFRSRTEARWARFFDAIGLGWEYEREGYESPDGTRYLPDFYIPSWQMYFEVKPSLPSEGEVKKLQMLEKQDAKGHWKCGRFLIGTPGVPSIYRKGSKWEFTGSIVLDVFSKAMPMIETFAMCKGGDSLDVWPVYFTNLDGAIYQMNKVGEGDNPNLFGADLPGNLHHRLYFGDGVSYAHPRLEEAYRAARSARFEFGEQG